MQAVFYALPVWYWYKGEINVGQFVLIQSLIAVLSNIYNMLSMNFINFFRLYGGIKDGLKLLSRPFEVTDVPNARRLKVREGRIDFAGVTYHYKHSEPLFNDFNLHIAPGEKNRTGRTFRFRKIDADQAFVALLRYSERRNFH